MIFISLFMVALTIFLAFALLNRFNAEKQLAKQVFGLSDREKHFITIVIKDQRLDRKSFDNNDIKILENLVESGWLAPVGDDALIGDSKALYLGKLLGEGNK